MKRGLVRRDHDAGAFTARIARLQRRLGEAGVAVALIYADVYRADDVAYLTNLCVYWNEAILAVPAEGEPVLLTKLSPRVHPWMRATSTLRDLRSGSDLAELVGAYLSDRDPQTLGVVDRGWWPAALVDDAVAAAPAWAVCDLPDAVRAMRLVPDERDRVALERAAAVAGEAARRAAGAIDESPNRRIALAELYARDAGATDVTVHCEALDGGAEAVQVTVQLANVWARAARRTGGTEAAAPAGSERALGAAEPLLRAGATRAQLELAACGGESASIRALHHADLGTDGELRPDSELALPLPIGAVVTLAAHDATITGPVTVMADTYLVGDGDPVALTRAREPGE